MDWGIQGCGNNNKKILAHGQVNGHNVLVQRKCYLSEKKTQITVALIYLTVLKQYINSLENSMKQDKTSCKQCRSRSAGF